MLQSHTGLRGYAMKRKQNLTLFLKIGAFITPFFIGVYGLRKLQEGNILDCAYKMVQLYMMEYNVNSEKLNWQVELARWLAPAMTVAVIFTVLFSLVENIRLYLKLRIGNMIAVHGDSANIDLVLKKIGSRAVHSDKKMVFMAKNHLLMFEDDFDMYHFIDDQGTKLLHNEDKQITICSEKLSRGNYENSQLIICNIVENCARCYWNKYPLKNAKEKILIIGFENYGQSILTQGILQNVVDVASNVEYHVVGDYKKYLSEHYKIHKALHVNIINSDGEKTEYKPYEEVCRNHDEIYFYDLKWYEVLQRVEKFDRIILVEDIDAENLDLLNELKTYFINEQCYIKFSDKKIVEALWNLEKDGIIPFGVDDELYDPEIILQEKLFEDARKIHGIYYAFYSCSGKNAKGESCNNKKNGKICDVKKCYNCPAMHKDWRKQNSFIRYSNVAQADHIPEKLRLLFGQIPDRGKEGIGEEAVEIFRKLPEKRKWELCEIEHIRWCRYHFMNNWDYAPERNNSQRRHNLLVPFDKLDKKNQEKDMDAYLVLEEIMK